MQITHLGHSCVLVEVADRRILIDPGTLSDGFTGLTDLDALIVTHQHPDHLDVERLPAVLRGNPDLPVYAEPQTAGQIRGAGFEVEDFTSASQIALGEVTVVGVGAEHAVIHADVPRVGNTGAVIRAAGEPVLFHPGDALDAEPGEVDVLAVPLNAPWCALKETIDFVRRVGARTVVPVHDGLLVPAGRGIYLGHVERLAPQGCTVRDLRGAGAQQI